MFSDETHTERHLREVLEKVVAQLHDASQVREGYVLPSGEKVRNSIYVQPLLDIIGDAVECPDCRLWSILYDEHGERRDPNDLTDEEAAAAMRWDRERAEDLELDRRLRERP